MLLQQLYYRLPPRTRALIKGWIAASGHKMSLLDSIKARHLASTNKRIDAVVNQISRGLSFAGVNSFEGVRCMEFGCGYVPTELAYYWARGAAEIIGIDYNRIAQLQYMPLALRGGNSIVPGIEAFSAENIKYLAPFDARHQPLPQVDYLRSSSVLEHIPTEDVGVILQNLAGCIAAGGVMIHIIDLRDHLDPVNDPNGFLVDTSYNRQKDVDRRGNRLRKSDWVQIFSALTGFDVAYQAETRRPEYDVPGYSAEDLATYSIIFSCRKTGR
jgi:hypothetical protein